MYTAELIFELEQGKDTKNAEEAIDLLLGTLRMNGQILGREFPIGRKDKTYRAYLLLPTPDSLDKNYANNYVRDAIHKLDEVGLNYSSVLIGEEPYAASVCRCGASESFILYTHYISLESPLRCGCCFGIVPLYRLPPTSNGEYVDILTWQSDYKACDTLQMNSATGERFALHQISRYNSSLSQRGIEICNHITILTGIPTYYYLYRAIGRGKKSEQKRKCPSCNDEWLLKEPLHQLFDFRCDHCRLLSNK